MTENNDEDILGSFYISRLRKAPEVPRRLPPGLLSGIAVFAFIALIWYAYPQGEEKDASLDVPLIKADATPYKTKPQDPGGMDVPHQDSTVFETLEKSNGGFVGPSLPVASLSSPKKDILLEEKKSELNLQSEMTAPIASKERKPEIPGLPTLNPNNIEKVQKQVAAPVIEPKNIKVQKDSSSYLQLGAFRTEREAKTAWQGLEKKYPQLQVLKMRLQKVQVGVKGTFVRLQVIVPSSQSAEKMCVDLRRRNVKCWAIK